MRKGKDFIGPFPLISLRTITQFHLPLVLVQIVDDVTELQCVIIFISLDSERDYLHGLGFKEKFVTQAS